VAFPKAVKRSDSTVGNEIKIPFHGSKNTLVHEFYENKQKLTLKIIILVVSHIVLKKKICMFSYHSLLYNIYHAHGIFYNSFTNIVHTNDFIYQTF